VTGAFADQTGPHLRKAREKRPIGTLFVITYYAGIVLRWVAVIMVIPALVSALSGEWSVVPDFLIGAGVALVGGSTLVLLCRTAPSRVYWSQGMLTVAVSWLLSMIVCAVPSWLSGHYLSFVDACFDVMSGFTTTGLVLIQDLDHVSDGLNTWRHLLSYLGGQGMIVLALSFLAHGFPGLYTLYVGEGKDERLLPSMWRTARAIWFISVVYLLVGTGAFAVATRQAGLSAYRGLLHAFWLFMSAWSTGGFAPQSQSILFYHSRIVEAVALVVFVLGSLNFGLHYAVWSGNRREVTRNLEIRSFLVTSAILTLISLAALKVSGVYSTGEVLFRKGVFHLLSAHTTTGFMTIYPSMLVVSWPALAMFCVVLAQLLGGSASSTAGGFKGVRVGIAAKTVVHELRRLLLPESAVVVTRFHFFRDHVLGDRQARAALLVIFLYTVTVSVTAVANLAAGYPLQESLFEAASVTGNVGLTAGLTSASMPLGLKLHYILVMWSGRLEFMAVLVLVGYLIHRRRLPQ